ncbi:hypothetical protein GOODEAATRI_023054 [Goodea atripinnis]|uniref:Uncharacterized protein n=1 Tax=Goodea atripinnis TaxID=208336 RepID=A0ABV0NMK1_9TELE
MWETRRQVFNQSLMDQGFPPVPALEPRLIAVFGVRSAWHIQRWPLPLCPSDQIIAKLTDCSHQCATQNSAFAIVQMDCSVPIFSLCWSSCGCFMTKSWGFTMPWHLHLQYWLLSVPVRDNTWSLSWLP